MLELSLTPNKTTFAVGELIEVKVALKNSGATPLLVNKRLVLNRKSAPEGFREIRLVVKHDGTPVPFAARVRIDEPGDNDFETLEPDAMVERTYPLSRYYQLDKQGQVSITAFYQNSSNPSEGEAWKGEVGSETVEVRVG